MQTFPQEIEYYRTSEGVTPFKEWLEALWDVNGRAKIRVRLDRARLGNLGDYKQLTASLWEMRIDYYGPGYRVYFTREEGRLILLLIGGDKDTQKRDITRAAGYLEEFQRRQQP